VSDPYESYRALRETTPILPVPQYERTHALLRHADCEAVLRDGRWSSASGVPRRGRGGEGSPAPHRSGVGGAAMLAFTHPPEHTRVRRLMGRAFTPRAVEGLRPAVQALVDPILDEAAERGGLDVMADLARVVPVAVIGEVLGVPVADRHRLGPWSVAATRSFDGLADDDDAMALAREGWRELDGYVDALIADRRAHPGDDLLSALIAAEETGDRLTTAELRVNAIGLLVAGHETTTNLIGNGTHALLRHPDQLARWHRDPALTARAVEELLRYDPMVQLVPRQAMEDVEVGGHRFPAGDHVIVVIGAANRDPARFAEPDRLDLGRDARAHLTFSAGMHHCLGAALARLEGQVVLGSLVARFPRVCLAASEVHHRDHLVLRGLIALPVTV
jgi:cytochrome P450